MDKKQKKFIKNLKKIQRDNQLDAVRKHGDIARIPRSKIFKDKRKEEKYKYKEDEE